MGCKYLDPAGAGKIGWDEAQVDQVAQGMFDQLPQCVHNLLSSGGWQGGAVVRLDNALVRPSAADVAINFHMLRPIVSHCPDKVSLNDWMFTSFLVLLTLIVTDVFVDVCLDQVAMLQVPSGYFLTDCILRLDELFESKMLVGGSSKLQLAAEEGVKLKKLMGAVRSLWRSSPAAGSHPKVTELKEMLRPSPTRSRARSPVSWHGICNCLSSLLLCSI